ncbi:MAG: biopolymer transporter ExbD [Elusimicrobiota bacterium]
MRKSPRKPIADLNITNLVDVTFALLIIFMITAPLMTQGLKVELPKLKASNIPRDNTIAVKIVKSRDVYIDSHKVPLSDFEKTFKKIYLSRSPRPVILEADKVIPYGIVIQVIGALKNIGVKELGFLTDPVETKDKTQSLKL